MKHIFTNKEEYSFLNIAYKKITALKNIKIDREFTRQFAVNDLYLKKFLRNKKRKYKSLDQRNNFSDVKIIPSIIDSVSKGKLSLDKERINLHKKDLLVPIYFSQKTINIIIVMDMSKSISWFIPSIKPIINSITSNIKNLKNKLGLIVFNNNAAQIIHYPTKNIRNVIGSLNSIKVKGNTPLSEGMEKALNLFKKPKYDSKLNKNVILLVSDCFPEPLTGKYEKIMSEPAYQKVLNVSDKIQKTDVKFMIINPSPKSISKNFGHKLGIKSAKKAEGQYIRVYPKKNYNPFENKKWEVPEEDINYLQETFLGMIK